ncbi:MAG: hypothetical protein ACRDV3_09745 [Acidothermaceae bacterium]
MTRPTMRSSRLLSVTVEVLVVLAVALIYVILVTRGRVFHWGFW